MRSAISESGGNASLAGASGRYGDAYPGTKAKAGYSQGGPEATEYSGGQGVHRKMESEGLEEKYRAAIDGGSLTDEPVAESGGRAEPALWGRRRTPSPTAPRWLRAARRGRTTCDLRRAGSVAGWHRRNRTYKRTRS